MCVIATDTSLMLFSDVMTSQMFACQKNTECKATPNTIIQSSSIFLLSYSATYAKYQARVYTKYNIIIFEGTNFGYFSE